MSVKNDATGVTGNETYQINGSMFVNVSDNTKYKLSDFKIIGHGDNATKSKRNYIQFFSATSLAMDSTRKYYYRNGEWLNKSDNQPVGDLEIPQNGAFLTVMDKRDGCELVFSGQVQKGDAGKIIINAPTGASYFCVANPAGREVSLSEVKITGHGDNATKAKRNYIQFFNKGALSLDGTKKFYYRNNKWLDKRDNSEVPDVDTIKIPAEAGVLVIFDSRDGCSVEFPSAL